MNLPALAFPLFFPCQLSMGTVLEIFWTGWRNFSRHLLMSPSKKKLAVFGLLFSVVPMWANPPFAIVS